MSSKGKKMRRVKSLFRTIRRTNSIPKSVPIKKIKPTKKEKLQRSATNNNLPKLKPANSAPSKRRMTKKRSSSNPPRLITSRKSALKCDVIKTMDKNTINNVNCYSFNMLLDEGDYNKNGSLSISSTKPSPKHIQKAIEAVKESKSSSNELYDFFNKNKKKAFKPSCILTESEPKSVCDLQANHEEMLSVDATFRIPISNALETPPIKLNNKYGTNRTNNFHLLQQSMTSPTSTTNNIDDDDNNYNKMRTINNYKKSETNQKKPNQIKAKIQTKNTNYYKQNEFHNLKKVNVRPNLLEIKNKNLEIENKNKKINTTKFEDLDEDEMDFDFEFEDFTIHNKYSKNTKKYKDKWTNSPVSVSPISNGLVFDISSFRNIKKTIHKDEQIKFTKNVDKNNMESTNKENKIIKSKEDKKQIMADLEPQKKKNKFSEWKPMNNIKRSSKKGPTPSIILLRNKKVVNNQLNNNFWDNKAENRELPSWLTSKSNKMMTPTQESDTDKPKGHCPKQSTDVLD